MATPGRGGPHTHKLLHKLLHSTSSDMEEFRTQDTCTPAERPQNKPITPHESMSGHWFSYNRLRASRGGFVEQGPIDKHPPSAAHDALAGPRSPAQLTSFCPTPSKHLGKPANGSPGREAQRGGAPGRPAHKDHRSGAGARDAGRPDPQLWCARAHTQAPAHRDACGRLTRNLRSCPTLRLPPRPVFNAVSDS